MPLYEYRCVACDSHLERRQRFDEAPLRHCPECGGTLVRMNQPAGIIFKGSGFYCTDHRPSAETSKSSESSNSGSESPKTKSEKVEKATATA